LRKLKSPELRGFSNAAASPEFRRNQAMTLVRSGVSHSPAMKLSANPMAPNRMHRRKNLSSRIRISACRPW
jgi:hypothetical protein